jgi:YHS domain-containing protein
VFLANPDQFSPVLSGVDPVVAVDQRKSVPGQREFAVQYPTSTGRFYLFSSQQTLEKFWENPSAYAQGAERVAALPAETSFVR